MATTNKALNTGTVLTTSAAVIYTAPAATATILKKVTVTSSSVSAASVTIYLVSSGGTPGANNCVTPAKSIASGGIYIAFECENHVLNAGDTLQALASAATSLSLKASGIEIA